MEPFKVDLVLDFPKVKKLTPYQQKKLGEIAAGVFDDYEDIMEEAITKTDQKIAGIVGKARVKGGAAVADAQKKAEDLRHTCTVMVDQAARSIEAAVKKELAAEIKRDRNLDELLLEFKIKVVYRVGKNLLKLSLAVTQLVAEGGLDPMAWKKLGTAVYEIGSTIHDAAKGIDTVRKELDLAIAKHTKNLWKEEVYQQKDQKSLKDRAKHLWQKHKKTGENAEKKRKRFDVALASLQKGANESSVMIKKMWTKLDKEVAKLGIAKPAAKSKIAEVGPRILGMSRDLRLLADDIGKHRAYADDMADLLTMQGVAVTRESFQSRLRSGQGKKDLFKMAKDIKGTAEIARKLAEEIAKLAA
jgi:hypothetical protein